MLDAVVTSPRIRSWEGQEGRDKGHNTHGRSDNESPEMFLGKVRRVYNAHMRFAILVLALACGGGELHTSSPDSFPSLQGRPVYSASLDAAPDDVSTVWPLVEEALAADATDLDAWSRERAQLIQRLDPEWGRLAQGAVDERLFAAITRGLLYDELASRVASPERRAEAAAEARRAYALCVREAPGAAQVLQDWSDTCLERSRALDAL